MASNSRRKGTSSVGGASNPEELEDHLRLLHSRMEEQEAHYLKLMESKIGDLSIRFDHLEHEGQSNFDTLLHEQNTIRSDIRSDQQRSVLMIEELKLELKAENQKSMEYIAQLIRGNNHSPSSVFPHIHSPTPAFPQNNQAPPPFVSHNPTPPPSFPHKPDIPESSSQARGKGIYPIPNPMDTMLTSKGILPTPRDYISERDPYEQSNHHRPYFNKMLPKCELPNFEGVDTRTWVAKCRKYFTVFEVQSEKQVELASLFLIGKAETWFMNWSKDKGTEIMWDTFCEAICRRFRDWTDENVVEELQRLRQTSTVEHYQDKFEDP